MAIRGVGDQALEVIERQRQAALKTAQLSEEARSNRAREGLAAQQLAAGKEQAAAGLEQRATAQAEETRHNQAMEQQDAARTSMQQANFQRNEEMFQQQKTLFEQDQAKRKTAMEQANSSFSGLIRATLFSPGAPPSMVTNHNVVMGVPDDGEGAMRRMFPIIDPKSRMMQGIGYITIGKDGQDVKNIVTPAQVWAALEGVYGPEKARELVNEYQSRYQLNDPMFAAGQQRALRIDELKQKTAEANLLEAQTKAKLAETGGGVKGGDLARMLDVQSKMKTSLQQQIDDRKAQKLPFDDLDTDLRDVKATIEHLNEQMRGVGGISSSIGERTGKTPQFQDGQIGVRNGMKYRYSAEAAKRGEVAWLPVVDDQPTGQNASAGSATSP